MDSHTVLTGGLVGAIGTVCTILLGTVGVAFKSISTTTKDLRGQLAERNEQFVKTSRTISELQYQLGQQNTKVQHLLEKCESMDRELIALRTELSKLKAENDRLRLPPDAEGKFFKETIK